MRSSASSRGSGRCAITPTPAGVAGVDEAGRGPLAGPVVVAAVVLPPCGFLPGLRDSKKLGRRAREQLAGEILASGAQVRIERAEPEDIDRLNILGATLAAMRRALLALAPAPRLARIDGPHCPAELPFPAEAWIGGDDRDAAIAAASILAKVERDRILCVLDQVYPGYGFARHKGYPTREHLAALRRLGPSPAHRRSFAPVARQLALWP